MKINDKILSIPPYLSTPWSEVAFLHTKSNSPLGPLLIVALKNAAEVEIPNLSSQIVSEIFEAYAHFKEEEKTLPAKSPLEGPFHFAVPLKKGLPIESLGPSMKHNSEQANLPNLPPEVLEKVTMIAKAFGLEDSSLLPQPEPHCNCIHCQIIRSLHDKAPILELEEEEVSEEDLKFRSWDVQQVENQLYTVKNPLDPAEQYNVFLGDPIGCTCGRKTCEHIRAVLYTA